MMLDHLPKLATRNASKIAKTSPSKIASFCAQIFVPAAIKATSPLRHQLQPLEPETSKKLASTLHFHQPTQGHYDVEYIYMPYLRVKWAN
jgi:hypothetical protein